MPPGKKDDRLYQPGVGADPFAYTPDQLRLLEAQWKSDVDRKIDRMVAFMDKTEKFLDMMIDREAKRAQLRDAIITKSVLVLVGAAIVFVGHAIWNETNMWIEAARAAKDKKP